MDFFRTIRIIRLIRNFQQGFTLIELLVVIFMVSTLTAVVTVNFSRQRSQQDVIAAAADTRSKIREVQNFTITGKVAPSGEPADFYTLTFTRNGLNWRIDYTIDGVPALLETVALPRDTRINRLLVNGVSRNQATVRMDAPFGGIRVNNLDNQTLEIEISHTRSGERRSVILNGVSGRIEIP